MSEKPTCSMLKIRFKGPHIFNVDRYILKQTHIYRGLDTKHITESMVIYKNINRRTNH